MTASRSPTTPPVPPEFTRNLSHFLLGGGQHGSIVSRLLDLVRRPRLGEPLPQIFQTVRSHRATLAAQNDESHGPIKLGDLGLRQRSRDLLGQAKARYAQTLAITLFDVVIDLHIPVADHYVAGQLLETIANFARNEPIPVDVEPRGFELVD